MQLLRASRFKFVLLALSGVAITATAQTISNDASAELRRQQERLNERREQLERPRESKPIAAPPVVLELFSLREAPCFPIYHIELTGELSQDFAWLTGRPSTSPNFIPRANPLNGPQGDDSPIGRCLGTQGVDLILRRLQNALVEHGYVTTRVVAAPQDLKSGTLTFTLIPGRIRSIKMAPDANQRVNLWNALPFKAGDVLNLRDIEQAIENLRRTPTVEADIQIAPAEEAKDRSKAARPGESDLIISYQQAFPMRLSLGVDDSGTRSTGKQIGNATLSIDSPLGFNDLFYINATHDIGHALNDVMGGKNAIFSSTLPGERSNSSETIHYEIPYDAWLLGGTLTQSRYSQTVTGLNQNYTYSGSSSTGDVKLSYLFYRDRQLKSTAYLKGFRRQSNNYIDDTEVEVQQRITAGWELGFNHRYLFNSWFDASNQASLDFNAAYKHGTGMLGAISAPEEAFGEGTSRFRITTADLNLQLPIKLANQRLQYSAVFRAQYNGVPFGSAIRVTSQDKFAIGGRYTVRGFDGENALVGEKGLLLRNDLAWYLDSFGLAGHALYVGVDGGYVGGPSTEFQQGNYLAGAVLGVKGQLKLWGVPAAPYRGVQYDIFVGTPVYKPKYFQSPRLTGGFSLSVNF